MNRTAFNSGLSHLCDSLAANVPREQVADAWYGHLAEIPGQQWTKIVQSLTRDLDSLPRNLPKTVLSYVDRRASSVQAIYINPDTGREYTGEEASKNLRRLEALKIVSTSKNHPGYKSLMACAEASYREGGTAAARKWGAHIEDLLDAEAARIDKQGGPWIGSAEAAA